METKPNFPSQWNRGTPTAQPPRKAPSKLRGLVAFLILIALAGGAAWYLLMPADRGKVEIKPSGSILIKATPALASANNTAPAAREDILHALLSEDRRNATI